MSSKDTCITFIQLFEEYNLITNIDLNSLTSILVTFPLLPALGPPFLPPPGWTPLDCPFLKIWLGHWLCTRSLGRKLPVQINAFKVLPPDLTVYHYDVSSQRTVGSVGTRRGTFLVSGEYTAP